MKKLLLCVWASVLGVVTVGAAEPDILIADFEGKDYGNWKVEGNAFGSGPAQGTLPRQMDVSGYEGRGLVNSYFGGDDSTGKLTSPPFKIERKYVNFLIGGGGWAGETCINLIVNGNIVRTATGPNVEPGGSEALEPYSWDVGDLAGKTATIAIVDQRKGGWGHINIDQIVQSNTKRQQEIVADVLYQETYRPQFHFTAKKNWLNDPNGLVFYKGEYHLFFQHNPTGISWGNMTWGHAVSRDLVHWGQLPNAIEPDNLGTVFSGSAVVDSTNTAGFEKGEEKTIVAIYTSAGGSSPQSKGQPFTQSIAHSNDRGRTWTTYEKNPVLPHIIGGNRDPKVVWHEPTKKWIMTLYKDKNDYAFFSSPDLKTWTHLHDITVPGCGECPDFFEMPVDGDAGNKKWVWTAANGQYLIGTFDGKTFTKENGPHRVDWGKNFYAVQTYSDIPKSDGRRIQIAWMNGGRYPRMPFNQQMSFPCELNLRTFPEGIRMRRLPVKEIETLHSQEQKWNNVALQPGDNPLSKISGDLFDIRAEIELGGAADFGLKIRGETVNYSVKNRQLSCLGRSADLEPLSNRIKLQILVDRTSLEVFGNDGKVSMTSCFLPEVKNRSLEIYTSGGPVRIISLNVYEINSIWQAGQTRADMRGTDWTRVGLLGETPKRITDAFPLSDQENKGGWVKFEPMSDEFEGAELDTSKWTRNMYWWKGRQPALFREQNVTVGGGKLHLTMRKEPLPQEVQRNGYRDYSSAASHSKVRTCYGYFEVKAKPMNSGGSSSFWFQQDGVPGWSTEIDVFEIGGKAAKYENKYNMNLHVFRTPTEKRHWSVGGCWIAPWRLADDYHVYGLEWAEDEIKYYVDGVVVRTAKNTHWHQPLYLIFDSETMPDWFGMPKDDDLPSTFSVEYVRAWKRSANPQ